MNEEEQDGTRKLFDALVSDRRRQLRNRIATEDNLSRPVEGGKWRWADIRPGGGLKPPEERAADQARAAERAAGHRQELEVLERLATEGRVDPVSEKDLYLAIRELVKGAGRREP